MFPTGVVRALVTRRGEGVHSLGREFLRGAECARRRPHGRGGDANLTAGVVSRWTGIPVDKMLEGEREKLLKMEEAISRRVVGQREAVEAVSTAVRRARAGLQDPNRPRALTVAMRQAPW